MSRSAERSTTPAADTDYRYDHFGMRHLLADMAFGGTALAPGDTFDPVEVATADGGTVTLGGPRDRPQVIVTGSLSCPMTESSTPLLRQLHEQHRGQVDVVLLSVREAHPGEQLPQPRTVATAGLRAQRLADHHDVSFTVAVDTLDGVVHHRFDHKPNAVLVLDPAGRVAYRGLWAAAIDPLRDAIEAVVAGRPPQRTDDRSMFGPMTSAIPGIPTVMDRAGPRARRDLRRSAPPMAAVGRLAATIPLSRTRHRSLAAMAILLLTMVAIVAVAARVILA
jgi:hypothetical protein